MGTWSVAVMEEENMPNRGSSLRERRWMDVRMERKEEGKDTEMDGWMTG